jgi:transposase-like protein
MTEIRWKEIEGAPTFWISDTGLVRREGYETVFVNELLNKKIKRWMPETIIKQYKYQGYLRIRLNRVDIGVVEQIRTVSILVATAFVDNPDPKNLTEVFFRDGNINNCHYTNLYWGARPRGDAAPTTKVSNERVAECCRLYYEDDWTAKALGERYGVSSQTVSRWVRGRERQYATTGIERRNKKEKYSDEFKAKVLKKLAKGESKSSIAREMEVERSTIIKWEKEHKKNEEKRQEAEKRRKSRLANQVISGLVQE